MVQQALTPNLNPTAATGVSLGVLPPKVGALTAEQTRGTEMASFRIPLSLKAMVSKIVNDPRSDFNGTYSHFYLQAVAYALFLHEPYYRGDTAFESWVQDIQRLDSMLRMQEPLEAFRERLKLAEEMATTLITYHSLDDGRKLLQEAVDFIRKREEPLASALTSLLRSSRPMQALMKALGDDERYGLSDEVDRLQKFMGGSL